MEKKFKTVDEYLEQATGKSLDYLKQMRQILHEALPDAEEVISYNMPAFKQKKVLVYYAAYPKHIGFYPTPSGIAAFEDNIKQYKHAKGSIQFPYDHPLPADLIRDIAVYRLRELS